MIRSKIIGTGGYLPAKVLGNADLEKMVDTTDAWIVERTGIRNRHIAADNELTSDLGFYAAREALENAHLTPDDIDAIIVATTTPDLTFPATATIIQEKLGMKCGFAFDVQAVCSGFMYALSVADSYIRSGTAKNILVIGAETLSRIVDWNDRNTCVLFGDGAGAVVLSACDGAGTNADQGILKILLRSDGHGCTYLKTSGGVSSNQKAGLIQMEGKEVFRYAVGYLADIANQIMDQVGVKASEVDYLVPHQANERIIAATAKKLGFPMDKVALTLPEQGNTSAASIPLALHESVKTGKAKTGDLLLVESMGGGFTWSSALIRL